jgi:uncharacterized protein YkwD
MRRLVRHVPKWIAPRLVLALLLTALGVLGLLLLPPLFGGGGERRKGGGQVATNPSEGKARAGACPQTVSPAAVRCEVNAIRVANGLPPVGTTKALRVAAARHSKDMVRRHYFAHVSPSGQTVTARVRRAGYLDGARRYRLGENIGWGSGSLGTPAAIVQAWMNSPPHRAIILTADFRDVGVGIAAGAPQGGDGRTYTLDVGRRGG